MLTRGITVDHTTVYRWVHKYSPELEKRTRRQRRSPWSLTWHVDETYLKVGGYWCYLYRTIDTSGRTIDFFPSTNRNTSTDTRFFAKALRNQQIADRPDEIFTDKSPALACAITAVNKQRSCPPDTAHKARKYLNNRIEVDHSRLKRVLISKGAFKNPVSAYRTLKGVEVMHSLRRDHQAWRYRDPWPSNVVVVERVFQNA